MSKKPDADATVDITIIYITKCYMLYHANIRKSYWYFWKKKNSKKFLRYTFQYLCVYLCVYIIMLHSLSNAK